MQVTSKSVFSHFLTSGWDHSSRSGKYFQSPICRFPGPTLQKYLGKFVMLRMKWRKLRFGRKDSRELWNSPCFQLPKMTLIRESDIERTLPSNAAGTRDYGSSALLVLPTTSISSPPLSQVLAVVGCLSQPRPCRDVSLGISLIGFVVLKSALKLEQCNT